jgi:hypothetical protein
MLFYSVTQLRSDKLKHRTSHLGASVDETDAGKASRLISSAKLRNRNDNGPAVQPDFSFLAPPSKPIA